MTAEGLKTIGQLSFLGGGKVFTLFEVDDPKLIVALSYAYNDLGKIEIIPVMETEELVKLIQSQ